MNYLKAKKAHIRLGEWGETIACRYLRYQGFEILLRNYRNKYGEIDIIAKNEDIISFVEVKTRRYSTFSRPAAALRQAQKERIKKSARRYLNEIGHPTIPFQYNLIEVIKGRWDIKELRYWENNF